MAETHVNQTNGAGRRGRKAGGAVEGGQTHAGPSKGALRREATLSRTAGKKFLSFVEAMSECLDCYYANHGIDPATEINPNWVPMLNVLGIERRQSEPATVGAAT